MIRVETQLNDRPFSLETGRIAKQASGSVIVRMGDTVVLVTAVASKRPKEDIDFLPLVVDYQEMFYAAGRIPGGYFKRELGRPSEKETLTSRFIDRPIRPLFPKGFRHETQIIATVLSVDPEIDSDVLAITGASAALSISDIPFAGPIAGVRVGRLDGHFVANPTKTQLLESDINLIVASSKDAIVMVEGGMAMLSEDEVLEAIFFGYQQAQALIAQQEELVLKAGKAKMAFVPPCVDEVLKARIVEIASVDMANVIAVPEKMSRQAAYDALKQKVAETLGEEYKANALMVDGLLKELEKELMRTMIIKERKRIDGRGYEDIRPISCSIGDLPRAHGSAVFTRGETQVLAIATLGSAEDEQKIDSVGGEIHKHFMLHYNFPPFCVGEVRPLRGPARRDIGHGALAERGLAGVVPPQEDFLYTIRVVSEVMESNGSSSMATVCGSTLALMDAGVPIRDMVAGIAMGLIKEGEDVVILSDILGDEDHLGDMDFKVVGTSEGITSLQMDIKIAGLTKEILQKALLQAKGAREHILEKMRAVISEPKNDISDYAPKVTSLKISQDRIKDLIGPGGKNIKGIVAACGVKVDVDEVGNVKIFAASAEASEKALKMVKALTQEAEVGAVYDGTVKKIMDFGAFVEILPGTEGLLHISQISNKRVNAVKDVLSEGDKVKVKVLEVDKQGKIRLSRKAILSPDED